jgi:hypothetical protein
MIRTVMLGLALVAATLGATKAAPKPASPPPAAKSADAPADEYFGPFKYSAISVRMKINALGRSYHERWSDDASIVHDALLVESSYRAWAQKYPRDRWMAPTAYHLAQLYQDVQTQDARNHARAMYEYLAKTFPKSKEAHLARLRLQQGFPALHPESPVSPTPNPYASAAPSVSPADSAAPAASGAPASPSASGASATPAAAASGAPGPATSPSAPTAAPSAAPKPAPSTSAKP